jgi:EAL and modified HD-GYP domain-containing signal transduction protein
MTPQASTASGPVFVARTPILTRRQEVLGYRLTAGRRKGPQPPVDQDDEAVQIAQVLAASGTDALTQGRAAFVRVTPRSLAGGILQHLPPTRVVLELDADIEPDWDVLDACVEARALGFRLALDDFTPSSPAAGLIPRVDFLKIDVRDPRTAEARARTVACFRQGRTTLIAKNVDTNADSETAAQDGFECLEGFFFQRPVVRPADRRMLPQQVTLLRLLRALNDPNLSIGELESLVKHDAALCYRILRAVNSAAAARRSTVFSMHDALLMLGRDMVRRWASIWTVAGLNASAHGELVVMSTVRARLCELLAASAPCGVDAGEAFMLGMCSLFDTILGRPMAEIVGELPLGDETRRALAGGGSTARTILDCVVAYERGAWDQCDALARQARVNAQVLPGAFLEAIQWAGELNNTEVRTSNVTH